MGFQTLNDVTTALASNLASSSATSASVTTGDGALFAGASVANPIRCGFFDATTGALKEIVDVTGRSTDTLTIVRAVEDASRFAAGTWTTGTVLAAVDTVAVLRSLIWVDVKSYGAKCDAILAYDGSVASGSATLTSAGAAFTSADVGKLIWVNGDVGTISTVIDATHLTLSFTPAYTQSNLAYAYGTNDATSLTAAAAALPATGGTLYVSGRSMTNGTLSFAQTQGVTIAGAGGRIGNSDLRGAKFTNGTRALPASMLISTATGSGGFISATDSIGLTIRDIGIHYCSTLFTGDLVSVFGSNGTTPSYLPTFQNVLFCGLSLGVSGALSQAYSLLNLTGTVCATIRECAFGNADKGVVGLDPNYVAKGAALFSNAVNFFGGEFDSLATASVYNPGTSWNFYGTVFEPNHSAQSSGIYTSSSSFPGTELLLSGCGFWDSTGGPGTNGWVSFIGTRLTVRDCYIEMDGSSDSFCDLSRASMDGVTIEGCTFHGSSTNHAIKQPTDGGSVFLTAFRFSGNNYTSGMVDESLKYGQNRNIALSHQGHLAPDDPLGVGVPFTYDPALSPTNGALGAANRCYHFRSRGGGTISKIAVWVQTSSGNIDVGVTRGAGGNGNPTSRVASSGSVACPAAGYAEVSLTAACKVSAATDFLALAANNTTARFFTVAQAGLNAAWNAGFTQSQSTSFPIPSSPSTSNDADRSYIMFGVA